MKVIPRETKKVITNSRELRELRKKLKLSDLQKKVLFGTLLGDGCLVVNVWGKNYRLQIEHSNHQKEYVFWKYNIFKDFVLTPPRYVTQHQSWRFITISSGEFTEFHKLFYKNKQKILPNKMLSYIDPLSLSVWFMDDGALGPHRQGHTLNTQSFSYEENLKLVEYLNTKLKIKNITLHKDKNRHRIYIKPASSETILSLIKPHIIPSMRYKLS